MIQQTRASEQYPLRLPTDLRDKIRASARENGRSMNSEIVFQLFTIFREPKTEKADARA